jgi:hypothetical protein
MKILLLLICVTCQLSVGENVGKPLIRAGDGTIIDTIGSGIGTTGPPTASEANAPNAPNAPNAGPASNSTEAANTSVTLPPAASPKPSITSKKTSQAVTTTKAEPEKTSQPASINSQPQSSKPPSTTSIITITFIIGGVILLSIIGIYIFRKTTLRKSNSFQKRLDPGYAPTLKTPKQSTTKYTIPKLDDYIQGRKGSIESIRVTTPPPQVYNNFGGSNVGYSTVGYNPTLGYNGPGSVVGYGVPAYQPAPGYQQFHHGQGYEQQYQYQGQGQGY